MAQSAAPDVISTIKLTTFAIYTISKASGHTPAEVRVLHGASDARFGDDGKVELLAGSVPFNSEPMFNRGPKPGEGLLMLYGVRDTLDELFRWRKKAREAGAEFASADIEVRVGYIEPGVSDRVMLQAALAKKGALASRFLNVRRMKAGLQSQILQRFSEYAQEEGADINEEMRRVSQIASRPDYFGRLLREDPDLSKLDVLVIPVTDSPEGGQQMRQMAYVRPGAVIESTVQSNSGARILLPKWMASREEGEKYRRQSSPA